MSVTMLEVAEHVGEDVLGSLDHEWEIPCEMPKRAADHGSSGFPQCNGDRAEWIMWRGNCCDGSPSYALICHICKTVLQNWAARKALISCAWCGTEIHPVFTPLRGSA